MKHLLRLFILLFIFFILLSLHLPKTFASVLFQDNFDNGSSSNWSIISGQGLWMVKNGMFGARIEDGSTIIEALAGNITTPNYILEYDMYPIEGVDKNVDFRWIDPSDNLYAVHFNSDTTNYLSRSGPEDGWPIPTSYALQNGQKYHFIIKLENQKITITVNNTQIFDVIDPDYSYSGPEQVGLRISTGSTYPTEVWFDNVKVTSIDSPSLSVPYFNQQTSPWGSTTYDHAQTLGFSPSTFSRWGCTVTSTAMVLKSYGMNQLPDGTVLDPGSLNQWLNNNNGYLTGKDSGGSYSYLDWTSIGKLARAAQHAGKSPTDVMVQVLNAPTTNSFATLFASDAAQQIPDIIQTHNASTSGHFVVTTGQTNSTYFINDPFWNVPTLASFNNNIDEVVRLIPSHTDLSYITLVTDPSVNIFLTNASGKREGNNGSQTFNEIPNAVYGLEKPIGSPTGNTTLGTGVNRLLLPTPTNGAYNVTLSSKTTQTFTLNISSLQTDGTSEIKTIIGTVGPQDSQTFKLNYSNTNVSSTNTNQQVTFASTLADIASLYKLKSLTFADEVALTAIVNSANMDYKLKLKTPMEAILSSAQQTLQMYHTMGTAKDDAFTILNQDISALKLLL